MLNRRDLLKCVPLLLAGCSQQPAAVPVPMPTKPPRQRREPISFDDVHLGPYPITVDLPLFNAVRDLENELDENSAPSAFGLYLTRPNRPTIWCAAQNGMEFSSTGGEGAFLSFLVTGIEINATTPVFVCCPAGSGETRFLADGFENFVRLGLAGGFVEMEQFVYQSEKTVRRYAAMRYLRAASLYSIRPHGRGSTRSPNVST